MSMAERRPLPTSTVSETGDHTDDLAERVRAASAARTPLRIVGGGTKAFYGRRVCGEPLEISGHTGVVDYEPSELVITARAGTRIAEIEALLAQRGQRLAFEPPILGSASTLGGVVAAGLAGPRRPFAGAVRDSVLGVSLLNGKGEILRFGGTVFKNVAGFDAFRLMAGALGCLGVLLEVSLRVAPVPAAETSRSFDLPWAAAQARLTALLRRPLPLSGGAHDGERLHVRLSGPSGAIAAAAAELGGEETPPHIWEGLRHRRLGPQTAPRLWRLSVSRTAPLIDLPGDVVRDWAGAEIWLASDAPTDRIRRLAADAGGHATLYRGATPGEEVFTPLPAPLLALHKRLKAAFDPAGVFNPGRMYEGL
jgi:glycolate oxidase FAD binding subunit